MSGLSGSSCEYFTLSKGVDTTPLFEGLEGNLCQCPHWGLVLGGRLTTTDAWGAQTDPRRLASLLVDCWEGAALRSRLRGDAEPLTEMLDFYFTAAVGRGASQLAKP